MSLGKIIDKKNENLFMKIDKQKVPEHVAIIMDGNGRWATKKGLPRSFGHKRGVTVLKEIINSSESLTKNNDKFLLNVCVNYGGRQEIVKVAKELALKSSSGEIKPSEVNEELFNSELLTRGIKDPELLIRTSGEKRISNFLLWQLAYSEIYISDVMWPDFNEFEFLKAIIDYQSRNRRFGGIESLPNESFEDSQYIS